MKRLFRSPLRHWTIPILAGCAFFAAGGPADAQFKVTGPAPYSDAVAREKIKTLLEKVDAHNRRETVETLTGLLSWYRNIEDEEMIAAWQKDGRENLPEAIKSLADARVATAIVDFSWNQQRPAAFRPAYASMFEDMMTRFPDTAKPMLDELLRPGGPPGLSESEAETVCRILVDMPDIGAWKRNALQILPHYRQVAERLIAEDSRSDDAVVRDRAQFWLYDPRSSLRDPSASSSSTANPAPSSTRRRVPASERPTLIGTDSAIGTSSTTASDSTRASVSAPAAPVARTPSPLPPPAAVSTPTYNGPMSGTLECKGAPIPQNAEYVFRNLPPLKIQLVYDTKIWEARLTPGDAQSQKLILKNKGSGSQKSLPGALDRQSVNLIANGGTRMKRISRMAILPIVLLTCGSALADVVTLKDGRQISGSVQSAGSRSLLIKVGDDSQLISMDQVASIEFNPLAAPAAPPPPAAAAAAAPDAAVSGPALAAAGAAPATARPGITLPIGTEIAARTIDRIDSKKADKNKEYAASLDDPLVVNGVTIAPANATAFLRVTEIRNPKLKGKASRPPRWSRSPSTDAGSTWKPRKSIRKAGPSPRERRSEREAEPPWERESARLRAAEWEPRWALEWARPQAHSAQP